MLTEICGYLNNFFVETYYFGHVMVEGNIVFCDGSEITIKEGQYFTIVNAKAKSILGTYKQGDELKDRDIKNGAVWLMDIPDNVISLADEIAAWMEKYGGVDSVSNSPYNSESFGGYSYTKSSGGSSDGSADSTPAWAKVYGARLAHYRRIR